MKFARLTLVVACLVLGACGSDNKDAARAATLITEEYVLPRERALEADVHAFVAAPAKDTFLAMENDAKHPSFILVFGQRCNDSLRRQHRAEFPALIAWLDMSYDGSTPEKVWPKLSAKQLAKELDSAYIKKWLDSRANPTKGLPPGWRGVSAGEC